MNCWCKLSDLVGTWLVDSTRPVIGLSGEQVADEEWPVGWSVAGDWWSVGRLRLKEELSVVNSTGWWRLGWGDDHWLENQLWLGERL